MTSRRQTRHWRHIRNIIDWFAKLLAILTITTVAVMVIPVSTALAAGIASVSLVLFGSLIVILLVFMRLRVASSTSRRLFMAAVFIAGFGLAIPQAAFLHKAKTNDITLTFDPGSYLRFSGDTTIAPDKIVEYRQAGSKSLRLAVYQPSRDQRQAVILLHGGGWRYGNFLQTGIWPERLTSAGITVITVEYRLSSDTYHTWKDAPDDIKKAVAYIKTNSIDLGVDPTRLSIMGQSAGGHLALLEAYRNQSVPAAVSLYAPADVELDYFTSRDKSAELDFIGGPPGQYPDRYRSLSPIQYVTPSTPRTLLVQGLRDDLVSPDNSTRLADKLRRSGVKHQLMLLPLTGHSFENQHGGFATQITVESVIRFLRNE